MADLALSTAVSSLLLLEKQMSVTSANIANANTPGYTAESEQITSQVVGGVGAGVQDHGTVNNVDQFLQAQVISANSDSTQASTFNTFYQNLQQAMGQITGSDTGGNDIASQIATLQSDLSQLAATPQNTALANSVVSDLGTLTSNMRATSQQVQSLRTEADKQISDTVDDANTQLDAINDLNTQIATAQARGASTAALTDKRSTAIEALSADIGIGYYTNAQGAVQIYTTAGQSLLSGNVVSHLSHAPVSISGNMSYPAGGINGIMVANTDITSQITQGKIGALIQQRDQELPAAQNTLDYLAQQLSTSLNSISNQGSAVPPPSTLASAAPASYQGTDTVVPSSDLKVRVALTDSKGQVQSFQDVDLSGAATVQDVLDDINGAFGNPTPPVATYTPSNGLQLSSPTAGQGVAVTTLSGTLSPVDASGNVLAGADFSSFFHLNDVITGGSSAATISVNPAMLSNSNLLPVGKLNNTTVPTPTVPFAGVGAGDGSTAQALSQALLANQTFTSGTATSTTTFSSPDQGLQLSGTFTINGGSAPVIVSVSAGETPASIAADINAAAAAAGVTGVSAQVTGTGIYQLQITSGSNSISFSNVTGDVLSGIGINSNPTGHLGASTTTFGGYAGDLISDVAERASTAQNVSQTKTTTLTALQTTFSNQSGVNVDQQTAQLTELQNLYSASARIITTQNAMFQSLLQAVGA